MPWARNPPTACALKRRQSPEEFHRKVEDPIGVAVPGGAAMGSQGLWHSFRMPTFPIHSQAGGSAQRAAPRWGLQAFQATQKK